MTQATQDNDPDLQEPQAMHAIAQALQPLDQEARKRVVDWAVSKYGRAGPSPQLQPNTGGGETNGGQGASAQNGHSEQSDFATFADLFHTASPDSGPRKILVAAYWVQVSQGNAQWKSHQVTRELEHLGHKPSNTSQTLKNLTNQKPAPVIQVSGKGHKNYKLTDAGIKEVRRMIQGESDEHE
jgi:hypothetical protein